MFRFANPDQLFWLMLVPLLAGCAWLSLRNRQKALRRFVAEPMLARLAPAVDPRRRVGKMLLVLVAMSLLLTALARPQFGTRLETVEREGQDVVVALDVSLSMLAEDIQPSRLAKAKHAIGSFIDLLQGDRIGLVAFAGAAFVQCPLTLDYAAARLFLDALDTSILPVQGTALEEAILKSTDMFTGEEKTHKVLVLITDGESHQGDPVAAAGKAAEQGVVIYTVGIGSLEGTPIPVRDERGRREGFKKDAGGNVVMTRLDQGTLQEIARETGGRYFRASPGERELIDIQAEIAGMDKKRLSAQEFTQFDEQFQAFVGLAWVLLVLELLLGERKRVGHIWRGRFQ